MSASRRHGTVNSARKVLTISRTVGHPRKSCGWAQSASCTSAIHMSTLLLLAAAAAVVSSLLLLTPHSSLTSADNKHKPSPYSSLPASASCPLRFRPRCRPAYRRHLPGRALVHVHVHCLARYSLLNLHLHLHSRQRQRQRSHPPLELLAYPAPPKSARPPGREKVPLPSSYPPNYFANTSKDRRRGWGGLDETK